MQPMKISMTVFAMATLLAMPSFGQSFDTPQAYFEDASKLRAQGKEEAAILQLRNALQLYGDHMPSLVLMGQLQLARRESAEAVQMLEEALLLGADPNIALPPLATAYLQRGEYSRLLARIPLQDVPDAQLALLLSLHAQAKISLGRLADAEVLIQRGYELDQDLLDLKLAEFTLSLRKGLFDSSRAIADALITNAPGDSRAWNAAASVADLFGDRSQAIAWYEKSIELEPYNADARVALCAVYIDLGQLEAAEVHISWMREEVPSDPRAAYFEALLAAMSMDREAETSALTAAAEIFDALSEERLATDPQVQMIGGLTYFGLGAFEKARDLVSRYVEANPEDAGAVRLLASTLLALGEANDAVQMLQPYNRRAPDDSETTILLASALNAAGRPLDAARILERIPGIGTGNHLADTTYAFVLSNSGATSEGATLLKRIMASNETTTQRQLVLASAYLRDAQWDSALELLMQLSAADPKNALYLNLIGVTCTGLGDLKEAERYFSTLTKEQPDFFPAWSNLAKLKRDAGALDAARKLLEKAQQVSPNEPRLSYEFARLSVAEGNWEDALRYAERAAIAQPGTYEFAKLEIELQLQKGSSGDALDAALRAATHENSLPVMQRLLAQTQARTGDLDQALITLKRAARNANFSALELNSIAQMQVQYGDFMNAASSIDSALKGDPLFSPARRTQAQIEIGLGNTESAIALAKSLIAEDTADPTNHLLLAEAQMANNAFRAAYESFEQAARLGANDIVLIGQVDALEAAGDEAGAFKLLTEYFEAGGTQPELRGRYADALIQNESWDTARRVLMGMHTDYPEATAILNNLAYVLHELRAPDALETARKALSLDTTSPSANDTLGWILLNNGRAEEALGYLREATNRASRDAEFRFHLASGLAALNRRTEALQELETAFGLGGDFRGRSGAVALREELESAR